MAMTMNVATRALVDGFFDAYGRYDAAALAKLLHDDVELTISGPVDVLAYCGRRSGKAAVVDLVGRLFPSMFSPPTIARESLVLDGDRAATLNRISSPCRHGNRVISYRVAHFLRFRDGLLIESISIIDSFDAAEQMLGHPFDLGDGHDSHRDDAGRASLALTDLSGLGEGGGLVVL